MTLNDSYSKTMPQQLSPLCDDRLFVPTFDKRPIEHDSGSLLPQKSTPHHLEANFFLQLQHIKMFNLNTYQAFIQHTHKNTLKKKPQDFIPFFIAIDHFYKRKQYKAKF